MAERKDIKKIRTQLQDALNELRTIDYKLDKLIESNDYLYQTENLADNAPAYRWLRRAIDGSEITIPFYDEEGVAPGNGKYLFSNLIIYPLSVKRIYANYPIGGGIMKLFVFVSKDNEETLTGYNVLQKYSPSPYLILAGGGGKVEVNVDPTEFLPKNYIKVYFQNESNEIKPIDVKVEIITYPLIYEE